MRRRIRIILLGMGVVGSSLAEEILAQDNRLGGEDGYDVRVVAVADSRSSASSKRHGLNLKILLERKSKTGLVGDRIDPREVGRLIGETEADMMVLLTSASPVDGEPALEHIKLALRNGMDVVTANKMPLALRYREILNDAETRGRMVRYSACVGGGIPVIEFGEQCGRGDKVLGIEGVLNATSNFILSEMEEGGVSFQSALKEARRLGYAEANPSLDVDGLDAACKIVILANHVLGKSFTLGDVRPLEGILRVSLADMKRALRGGKRLRMVASAEDDVMVKVTAVPETDPICARGTDNAARFNCQRSGPRVVRGPAGGGPATSAAVIRDILAIETARRAADSL